MQLVQLTLSQLVLSVAFGTIAGFWACTMAQALGDLMADCIQATWNKRLVKANSELQTIAAARPATVQTDDDLI